MQTFQTSTVKRYDWDAMSEELAAHLEEHPEGVTLYDICEHLDVAVPVGRKAINKARAKLGADAKANIITRIAGLERMYVLATAADGAALEEWLEFHRKSARGHLESVKAVYLSVLDGAASAAQKKETRRVIDLLDESLIALA